MCNMEGVKSYFNLRSLQHASTYIAFDGMAGKVKSHLSKTIFLNWNIELNIKKVMSKDVMSPYNIFWRGQRPLYTKYTLDPFDKSKMSNITVYTMLYKSGKHHFWPFRHE